VLVVEWLEYRSEKYFHFAVYIATIINENGRNDSLEDVGRNLQVWINARATSHNQDQ
jgi:hypothetical protein